MYQKAISKIKKSIFPVFLYNTENEIASWEAVGTGFFINENGYFLTSHHVINFKPYTPYRPVFIGNLPNTVTDGPVDIKEVFSDPARDIFLGRIDRDFLPPVQLSFDTQHVGKSVVSCGYPLPEFSINSDGSLELSKVRQYWQPTFVIDQYDADYSNATYKNVIITRDPSINGMSGGPLFDKNGNVIGMSAANYHRNVPGSDIRIDNGVAIKISSLTDIIKMAG